MGDPLYVIAAPILPQKNLPETPKTPFVDFQQLCIYVESFSGSKKKIFITIIIIRLDEYQMDVSEWWVSRN